MAPWIEGTSPTLAAGPARRALRCATGPRRVDEGNPRPVRLLPRLGSRAGCGRPRRGCGPGGALLPGEARSPFSAKRGRLLPEGGGHRTREPRPRGVLREALSKVRAPAGDVHGGGARRVSLLLHGDAPVDPRKTPAFR